MGGGKLAECVLHVVDLQFEAGQGVERPSTPAGLTADEVSDSRVTLSWQPSSGPQPIERYRLIRNGTDTFEVPASATRWHDSTVVADATYHYSIIAIDVEGAASLPATPIVVAHWAKAACLPRRSTCTRWGKPPIAAA